MAHKEPDSDDPMELVLTGIPGGDPVVMARCIIEEYAMMGFDETQILGLFREPDYRTHHLYQDRGEQWVRELIQSVLASTGKINITVKHFYHIDS